MAFPQTQHSVAGQHTCQPDNARHHLFVAAFPESILRKLRVAFSASELHTLRENDAFAEALSACDGSKESVQALVTLGGSILSQSSRAKSTFHKKQKCP